MYKFEHSFDIKPIINEKYIHLAEDEILFLYNNDNSLSYKLLSYNRFKKEYPNLVEFEKEFSKEMLIDNKNNDNFPNWYILRLVEYERIVLDLQNFLGIGFQKSNIANIKSRLIDPKFIERFINTAINIEYNKDSAEKSFPTELIRIMLYLQDDGSDLGNKLAEYKNLVDAEVKKGLNTKHRTILLPIATILKHMGFNINPDTFKNECKDSLKSFNDLNPEFEKLLKLYKDTLIKQNKVHDYIKSEISHNRVFFRYLFNYHKEVEKVTMITNAHITQFIEQQKNEINSHRKKNENGSINKRLNAINRMLDYLRIELSLEIPENIITKYDKLKVANRYPQHIQEKEISELIYTILNGDSNEKLAQYKAILTICMDTGRRIHEVLLLKYDCYSNGRVEFHKTKKGKGNWQEVGEATELAIMVLKKYADKFEFPIFSEIDGLNTRRLAPSRKNKGRTIVGKNAISDYFDKLQLEFKIVDKDGLPKFQPHDLKRIFISCLQNAGVSPVAVAKFLDQNLNCIVPYEINGKLALEVLKKAEEKGLLVGKGYKKESNEKSIYNFLNDIDVIKRNSINLMTKINNPSEVMPLILGECTDVSNSEICGDLICMSCDEFKPDSLEGFYKYTIKMYKYIFRFKRNKNVINLEKKLAVILEEVYERMDINKEEGFKKVIFKLRKIAREELEDEKAQ